MNKSKSLLPPTQHPTGASDASFHRSGAVAQMLRVVSRHAHALTATQTGGRSAAAPLAPVRAWRLAVIGAALGSRLQRPALLRRLGRPLVLLGPVDNAAQAAAALQGSDLDAVLVHEPHLHEGWLAVIDAAAPAFAGVPKAVLYGYAADPVCEALATAGTALLREPQPDAVLGQWLHSLSSMSATAPQPAPRESCS